LLQQRLKIQIYNDNVNQNTWLSFERNDAVVTFMLCVMCIPIDRLHRWSVQMRQWSLRHRTFSVWGS